MTIVIIVIVLVVIAVGGALIARQTSQRRQFGPEYDQLVQEVGQRQARAEFGFAPDVGRDTGSELRFDPR